MHVTVIKRAYDVNDHVDTADVREKLVAESLTFMRTLHKARDIDKLNRGWNYFLRLRDCRQLFQPFVWNLHHADIRLDGTKRKIRAVDLLFGKRFKQSGLADVWQTNDSYLQHSVMSS